MNGLVEFLIRTFAFLRKELFETLRQPRLVALLVLGPFLILLIFGLGYTNENRILRTLIVVPPDSVIRDEVEAFAQRLPSLNVMGLVENESEADSRLLEDEADLIIVTPSDPLQDILGGQHALVSFKHREIDPIELLYINTLERVYINTLNQEVVALAAKQAKEELANSEPAVAEALSDATALQTDLRRADVVSSADDLRSLGADLRVLAASIGAGTAALEGVRQLEGGQSGDLTEIGASIQQLEAIVEDLNLEDATDEILRQEADQVEGLVVELIRIQGLLSKVDSLNPSVVARPFEGRLANLSGVTLGAIDFFVPGTIALLLQHIALTLAALSIVREKRGGSIEIFRAAPLSSFETLLGKSVSFFLITGLLAATLTALLAFALTTPMEGEWSAYALVVAVLLYESLGLGFLISSVSETDTQAVQYSMIVLLASIFFTGFFIALHRLAIPVYLVSALLPATWGTAFLQHVMLRGETLPVLDLTIPFTLGSLYYLLAWWRTRRLLASI